MTMRFDYGNGSLWLGDCLALMPHIADASVDMVLCDLPYGTTVCKWDNVIPFEPLWREYWRICKPNAAIVLTASQPFTSRLIMSQINKFRYDIVWDKVNLYTGTLNANKMPLRRHESVIIFYKHLPTYNKQYRIGKPYHATRTNGRGKHTRFGNEKEVFDTINDGRHNPCSIIPIEADIKTEKGLHPTQKPVALFDYLIRTYTNPGDLVLDNCAGSGTTTIAAQASGRRWLCIEKELPYYLGACGRIWKACQP